LNYNPVSALICEYRCYGYAEVTYSGFRMGGFHEGDSDMRYLGSESIYVAYSMGKQII